MILRIEQNETEYWELVVYHKRGRTVLKHHGEFKLKDDAIDYALSFLCQIKIHEAKI